LLFALAHRASHSFEEELIHEIAELFNNSSTAKYLISAEKPSMITDIYGFDVKLIDQLPTSMHSSGEGHQLYIYERVNNIVGRGGTQEVGGVRCDPLFAKRYGQVSSGPAKVVEQLDEDIQKFCAFNPVKERGERQPRKMYKPEDFRANEKKSAEKGQRKSKPSPAKKKAQRKPSESDNNVPKRKKKSLKKRKRVDKQPNSSVTVGRISKTKRSKHGTEARADDNSGLTHGAGARADDNSGTNGEWKCPRCSLDNLSSAKSCDACGLRFASWSCHHVR